MTPPRPIRRPLLARHARYRWDNLRRQHQVLFPEGLIVLNDTGGAIVRLCDGRSVPELVEELANRYSGGPREEEVTAFLEQLAGEGFLRDVDDP